MQTQAEHLSQTGVIPLTPEELSVKVLKPRSGYVKGQAMRPSSSMNTIVAPVENSDYVQRLEMQIEQQNEQIARFQKLEKKQSKKIQSIIECLRQKGITGNFESGESSDSDGQASWLAIGGNKRVIATRRPGEHPEHLRRNQCKLWKLTELAQDSRFEIRYGRIW
ncbi:hypothetical protein HYC85_028856 [Camellia sinensis]|uniref:Uncharacterized protein n=1 Tax=Camellia sinensis TaxID=4442 RepID=A0A7J7FWF4_CAMSI|nr:hypothetical protein HYC85_028856 [Camellia sinensis]